jgi:recombination protein RecA
MDANKSKALEAALGQIERQFGKGTVMRMGEGTRQAIPAISTGSLDWILRLVLAVCRKGVSLRSTALNHRVKPH